MIAASHRGQDAEAAADVVGDDEAGPAGLVGQGFEHAALCVGGGEDVLVCLVAVLLDQQLAEDAEGDRGLERGAGLGDDVDVEVHVAERLDGVVQRVGGEGVAHEKHAGIALAGAGLEKLDRALGAEVGAADADGDEGLRAAADLLGRGDDGVELGVLDALGQAEPAGEVRAEAGALGQGLVGQLRQLVVGAGCGEEGLSARKVDFDHESASCICCSVVFPYPHYSQCRGGLSIGITPAAGAASRGAGASGCAFRGG